MRPRGTLEEAAEQTGEGEVVAHVDCNQTTIGEKEDRY